MTQQGPTYRFGKHRKYTCPNCGGDCHRPLVASDGPPGYPFPLPCTRCDAELAGEPYVIVDSARALDGIFRSRNWKV